MILTTDMLKDIIRQAHIDVESAVHTCRDNVASPKTGDYLSRVRRALIRLLAEGE